MAGAISAVTSAAAKSLLRMFSSFPQVP
jgi:hypothetical protein